MASATILVVDDNVVLLEGVSKLLDRRGFNVIPAASAHEALEIVRTGPPIDLILSDVVMPECTARN
jgi:CheY-like chemotaxis protein